MMKNRGVAKILNDSEKITILAGAGAPELT